MNKQAEETLVKEQLQKLVNHLESLRIAQYVELLEKPSRLIITNFVAGLARGLGIAIGATLIFALMLDMLRRLIMLNIPGIGSFISEIVRIVETNTKF